MEIKEWQDVNNALRRLGEIEIASELINGNMTLEMNNIKDKYAESAKPLFDEKEQIELDVINFCEVNKGDFKEPRSKVFDFGIVAFKVSKSVSIKKTTLEALKKFKMFNCIRVKEEVAKDILMDYDDNTLAKVGAIRKVIDNLRIEPNIEKVKEYIK